jgi:hypothetical protein
MDWTLLEERTLDLFSIPISFQFWEIIERNRVYFGTTAFGRGREANRHINLVRYDSSPARNEI